VSHKISPFAISSDETRANNGKKAVELVSALRDWPVFRGGNGTRDRAGPPHPGVALALPLDVSWSAMPADLLPLASGALGDADVDKGRATEVHRLVEGAEQILPNVSIILTGIA
jgi:hypothetical protein